MLCCWGIILWRGKKIAILINFERQPAKKWALIALLRCVYWKIIICPSRELIYIFVHWCIHEPQQLLRLIDERARGSIQCCVPSLTDYTLHSHRGASFCCYSINRRIFLYFHCRLVIESDWFQWGWGWWKKLEIKLM